MARHVLALSALALLGCGSSTGGNDPGGRTEDTFSWCVGRGLSLAPEEDFRHTSSSLVAALGEPIHAGEDAIVAPDQTPALSARFGYGLLADDLEDEHVRVWFDDCSRFRELGDFATDDEGRVSVPPSERLIP